MHNIHLADNKRGTRQENLPKSLANHSEHPNKNTQTHTKENTQILNTQNSLFLIKESWKNASQFQQKY